MTFNEIIQEHHIKEYNRKQYISNSWYINNQGQMINKDKLDKLRDVRADIFDYYYMQDFTQKRENELMLFITITIKKDYNILAENIEQEQLNNIKKQNELIEETFTSLRKNLSKKRIRFEFVKAKELTKKNNIHIHTLFKINQKDLIVFIETIKNTKNKGNWGRVEIVLNLAEIRTILIHYKQTKKDYYTFKKNLKNYKIMVALADKETFRGGDFVYIKTTQKRTKKTNNKIYLYILKYLKKGQKTNEQIILNYLNIKKVSYSNTNTTQKKELINLVYNIHLKLTKNKFTSKTLRNLKITPRNLLSQLKQLYKKQKIKEFDEGIFFDSKKEGYILLQDKMQKLEKVENQGETEQEKELINILLKIENNQQKTENIKEFYKVLYNLKDEDFETETEQEETKEQEKEQRLEKEQENLFYKDFKINKYYCKKLSDFGFNRYLSKKIIKSSINVVYFDDIF